MNKLNKSVKSPSFSLCFLWQPLEPGSHPEAGQISNTLRSPLIPKPSSQHHADWTRYVIHYESKSITVRYAYRVMYTLREAHREGRIAVGAGTCALQGPAATARDYLAV